MNPIVFILGIGLTLFSIWNGLSAKIYRPIWRIFAFLLVTGFLCLLVGELGATLDENGFLHEVGLMLPFGGMFFLFGAAGAGILSILSVFRFLYSRKQLR